MQAQKTLGEAWLPKRGAGWGDGEMKERPGAGSDELAGFDEENIGAARRFGEKCRLQRRHVQMRFDGSGGAEAAGVFVCRRSDRGN